MKKDMPDKAEVEKAKKEAEEFKNKYLRALADYQNLEKRIIAQRAMDDKLAAKKIIQKILGVIDILEKVEKHLKDESIKLALKAFYDVLKSEDVEKINVVGKKFDPTVMECVEVAPGNDDVVSEEIRAGYIINGQILRIAQVKVGQSKESAKEKP